MRSAIPGVAIDVAPEAVWVRSEAPLAVLSSAVLGGELTAARHILNMHVHDDYRGARPDDDLRTFARGLGIVEAFVGLMTAAWTQDARVAVEQRGGVTVTAVATVGLRAPSAAGVSAIAPWHPSTINIIVVLDAGLAPGAAVNGVITATEAKVGALAEARVVTPEGLLATGTVTDAVVIAWTGRGATLPYLGPAASGGWLLGRAVRRAVGEAVARA